MQRVCLFVLHRGAHYSKTGGYADSFSELKFIMFESFEELSAIETVFRRMPN